MATRSASATDSARRRLRSAGQGRTVAPFLSSATWTRLAAVPFALALLYPFAGFFAPIGPWEWSARVAQPGYAAIRTSLALTGVAMCIVVVLGTPLARYITRAPRAERFAWHAALLVSTLLPPLALGILLALAFGPASPLGATLGRLGFITINSVPAFIGTQVYVAIGYYILGAVAAFDAVPDKLEAQAGLLGDTPWRAFIRVTLPLARGGLAVALSIAWVRALGEFGAVAVTAYHPSGMPVQMWTNLESYGLPAVMPLLLAFIAAALPLPWLVHVVTQRGKYEGS